MFTRTVTDELAGLVSQIDESLETYDDQKLSAILVLMTDQQEDSITRLNRLARERRLKEIPLTIYPKSNGPDDYHLNEDYETTILMWRENVVQANHGFQNAELTDFSIRAVMDSLRDLVK